MPFILPYQRTKISNSTRFSKYKNIDESSFFLLQKLKSTFRSADSPTYRIITQHHPYYEVANGMDLNELRGNWDYLVNRLPSKLPTHLPPKGRQAWFIAHFTQLALESGNTQNIDEYAYPFTIPPDDINNPHETDEEGEYHPVTSSSSTLPSSSSGGLGNRTSSGNGLSLFEDANPSSSSSANSQGNNNSIPPLSTVTQVGSGGSPPLASSSSSSGSAPPSATTPNRRLIGTSPPLYSLSGDEDQQQPHGKNTPAATSTTLPRPSARFSSRGGGSSEGSSWGSIVPKSSIRRDPPRKRRSLRITPAPSVTSPVSPSTTPSESINNNNGHPNHHELKGAYVWGVTSLFVNIGWLLLRDAKNEVFWMALVAINLFLWMLLAKGKPVTIGIVFIKPDGSPPHAHPSVTSPTVTRRINPHVDVHSDEVLSDTDGLSDPQPLPSNLSHRKAAVSRQAIASSTSSSLSSTRFSSAALSSSSHDPTASVAAVPSMANATRSVSVPTRGPHSAPLTSHSQSQDAPETKSIPRSLFPAATASFSLIGGRIPAGITLTRGATGGMTWCTLEGPTFNVRGGQRAAGKKRPSGASLFEVVACDIFQTPGKQTHIMQHVALPAVSSPTLAPLSSTSGLSFPQQRTTSGTGMERKESTRGNDHEQSSVDDPSSTRPASPSLTPNQQQQTPPNLSSGVPSASSSGLANSQGLPNGMYPYFVVNFMIPAYAPANPLWSSGTEDGPGYSLVVYFQMTQQTKEHIINPPKSGVNNSIGLLRRFLLGHPKGEEIDEIRRRLKAIPRLANPEEISLGVARSLVNSYNAKPFMTGPRCHTFIRGPDYLEVDVDVHKFAFLARKGAWSLWDSLPEMILDIALVVEARHEEEMPEQVIGGARISKLQPTVIRTLQEWKAAAQPSSASSSSISSSSSNTSSSSSSLGGASQAPATGNSLSTASPSPVSNNGAINASMSPIKSSRS